MQRLEVSETATPEELEAVAQDLSTKVRLAYFAPELTKQMLLTTWKATRWEVINVSFRSAEVDADMADRRRCRRAGTKRAWAAQGAIFEPCQGHLEHCGHLQERSS